MGTRITSRRWPRLNRYPWPYPTEDTTLSALEAPSDPDQYIGPYESLIGPMSKEAVMELLYRVLRLDFDLYVTYQISDDPPTNATDTATGTITADTGNFDEYDEIIPPTEAEVFARNRQGGTNPPDAYPFLDRDTELGDLSPMGGSVIRTKAIYEDENGDFWIKGTFLFTASTGTTVPPSIANSRASIDAYPYDFPALDVPLSLASGVFNIKAHVAVQEPFVSASLTITATEWHPYATKSGDPAWDILTGLPINGGPGA